MLFWCCRKLNEYSSPSSLTVTHSDIWHQFERIFFLGHHLDTFQASSKLELFSALNNLQLILFNDQPLFSQPLPKFVCAALVHILHCVCYTLYVCECYPLVCGLVNVHIDNSTVLAFRPAHER